MRRSVAQVAAACSWAMGRSGVFATKALASEAIPENRISKWREGEKHPRCWEVRELLRAMVRQDAVEALEFLDRLLGLSELGVQVSMRTRGRPEQALPGAALEVAADAGELASVVGEAVRDRHVSAEEGAQVAAVARRVQVAAARCASAGEEAELAHQPLLALAGGCR